MATNRYIIENSHTKIIQRKRALGYCDERDVSGGCFGVMSAGVPAILIRDVKSFDERVTEICDTPPDKIEAEVTAAQRKYKDGAQLNDHDLAMLNAHPLFYNMHLSHNSHNGKELFPDLKYIKSQNILLTSQLILPLILENEGGLAIADHFSGAYTSTEIVELFKTLRETLLANDTRHPIAFKLESPNHSMVVGYDPDCDKWILVDANLLPSQLCTDEELSEFLKRIANFCVFSTEAIVTKRNELSTKSVIQQFKNSEMYMKLHTITPERLKRVNGFNATWLHVATGEGDTDKVQELLDQYLRLYIDTNQFTSGDQLMPIWKACQEGYTKVVELLLKYGAHPDGISAEGKLEADELTPLGVAAQNGHIDVVRLLIHAGADVNWINGEGSTPLIKAAYHGHTDVAQELILSGADIDHCGNKGVTALLCASQNGHTKIVRMLLEHGASPNIKATPGDTNSLETPLSRAVDEDHPDIVKLLVEFGADISDQSRSLILHALIRKKKLVFQHLLNAGVDPNEKVGNTKYKSPLLCWAITEDDPDVECIDVLLKAGADPNTVSNNGVTVLAAAVELSNEIIARMLLKAGAKVDTCDSFGQSLLFQAVNNHSTTMVSLLLEAGADPNLARNNSATMLAVAAHNGDTEIVKQLLKHQADINQVISVEKPDSDITIRMTAMDFARIGGNEEIIKLLEWHIQSLSNSGNYEACRFFAVPANDAVINKENEVIFYAEPAKAPHN